MNSDKKGILETGIKKLSTEPKHMYEILDELMIKIQETKLKEVLEILNSFDTYAYNYLNREEYYAEISNFPKIDLLKSDHDYYKATFYRIRYHFMYFDSTTRKYSNILQYGLHLAGNLKEWLDFHLNTLDEELISHLKSELQKL
jgi:hemerythrin